VFSSYTSSNESSEEDDAMNTGTLNSEYAIQNQVYNLRGKSAQDWINQFGTGGGTYQVTVPEDAQFNDIFQATQQAAKGDNVNQNFRFTPAQTSQLLDNLWSSLLGGNNSQQASEGTGASATPGMLSPVYNPAPGTEGFAFGQLDAQGNRIPWKKEGTYQPATLSQNHTVWTTEKDAYMVIDKRGQIISSGSEGAYQAIKENPNRYPVESGYLGFNTTEQNKQAVTADTEQAAGGKYGRNPDDIEAEAKKWQNAQNVFNGRKGATYVDMGTPTTIPVTNRNVKTTEVPDINDFQLGDTGRFNRDQIDFQDALIGVTQYNPNTMDRVTHSDDRTITVNDKYKGNEGEVLDSFNWAYTAYQNAGDTPEIAFDKATQQLSHSDMITVSARQADQQSNEGTSIQRDAQYYRDSAAPFLADLQNDNAQMKQIESNPELSKLYYKFESQYEQDQYIRTRGGDEYVSDLSSDQETNERRHARTVAQDKALDSMQQYMNNPDAKQPDWMARDNVDYQMDAKAYRDGDQEKKYDQIYMDEWAKAAVRIYGDGQVPDIHLTDEQREQLRYKPDETLKNLFGIQIGEQGGVGVSLTEMANIAACNIMNDAR